MPTPKKRRPDRTEKRATQRYTPPESSDLSAEEPIPRPPTSCAAWHFYWCDNHDDWHHHDEFVIEAIQRSMPQSGQ